MEGKFIASFNIGWQDISILSLVAGPWYINTVKNALFSSPDPKGHV